MLGYYLLQLIAPKMLWRAGECATDAQFECAVLSSNSAYAIRVQMKGTM